MSHSGIGIPAVKQSFYRCDRIAVSKKYDACYPKDQFAM